MLPEDSLHHPQRRDQHMNRIGEKRRPVSFDHMTESGQTKGSGDQQQPNDPVEPNDNDGREPDGNGNHMQRSVYRMGMRVVVVVEEAQGLTSGVAGL